jgi:phosphopentomutase
MAPFEPVVVVVLDSVGCGDAPDAASFGDLGANTLGHVIERERPSLPNLARLGLSRIPGVPALAGQEDEPLAAFGRLTERAPAKDTMLGHWELMGVVAKRPFPTYPDGFPSALVAGFEDRIGTRVLGNRPASGTEILGELGTEHLRTGRPILYTSGDSVFQLAAHEQVIPVERLYEMCSIAREMLHGDHGVGRVIARPFLGDPETGFTRTPRRHDFALAPPGPTALDLLLDAGIATFGIGKIHDIMAGRGIAGWVRTDDNAAGIRRVEEALRAAPAPFVFANLVDFDSKFGHRNDPAGYAAALEELDAALPAWLDALPEDGLLILTADHGNDPTTPGTDHTRERVPVLAYARGIRPVDLGTRACFGDLGCTVLDNFGVEGDLEGSSFLPELTRC